MDANQTPPQTLELDPELLGHDPELASTVESLKRPRSAIAEHAGPEKGDPSLSASDSATLSPRNVDPTRLAPARARLGVPSGFFIRALPLHGALRRRLPITLLGAALIAVVAASAVAWGMMYLLKPSAFAKPKPSEPRVTTNRDIERGRAAPVQSSVSPESVAALTAKGTNAPSSTTPLTAPNRTLAARMVGTPIRGPSEAAPRRVPASVVVGGEPDTSATAAPEPSPASAPAPERKAWFE